VHCARKEVKDDMSLKKVWKARFVFGDFPYWKFLNTPHSLDFMHIIKNMCDSFLDTQHAGENQRWDESKKRYHKAEYQERASWRTHSK
jgi:hypothetical protein